jgi:dihydrolipoamide dehydrogenase
MSKYDIAVIGSGPGGYHAAIKAAKFGKKCALIEKDAVGGVCLNRGCIPTKAFASSAHAFQLIKNSQNFGINTTDAAYDFSNVQQRKQDIVNKLKKGTEQLLKANKVDIILGEARFKDKNTLIVSDQAIYAENIIIATGSSWINIPNINPDGNNIVTSDEILEWKELPASITIVGGGYIGCEFASILNAMEVEVTVVEATESLIPNADINIIRMLSREFKKKGIKVFTQVTAESIQIENNKVKTTLSNGEKVSSEKLLVSIGRKPDATNLNLENIGVKIGQKGEITVDENFKTNIDGIYAIGDVTGQVMLAHVASEQGVACVGNICGHESTYNTHIPACIFTEPEIAYVGMTEKELKEKQIEYQAGKFAFAAMGKPIVDGAPEGQIIVYAGNDNKLLGVHIIGKDASVIIAEASLAIKNGLTIDQITETIHAHPTTPEVFLEAVRDVNGDAIHKVQRSAISR